MELPKETTLERADSTLQLFMLVTAKKEKSNVYNFLSFHFLSAVVPAYFKLEQPECVQTMKAQINQPRRQLFLM